MPEIIFLSSVLLLVAVNVVARKFLAGVEGHDLPTMLNDN